MPVSSEKRQYSIRLIKYLSVAKRPPATMGPPDKTKTLLALEGLKVKCMEEVGVGKVSRKSPPSKHSQIPLQTSQGSLKYLRLSPFPATASVNGPRVEDSPKLLIGSAPTCVPVSVCLPVRGCSFLYLRVCGVLSQVTFL